LAIAACGRPDAGALVPQQHRDRLELRAHDGRHPAASHGLLDFADGAGQLREDVAAATGAPLLPRDGAASARLALACSSH
jgi:hypothetical protein